MTVCDQNPPSIADHLPIALRAFAARQWTSVVENKKPRENREPIPASDWTLIFDTETTTHAGQSLRFGTYQVRDGLALHEAGIFYAPDGVSADELGTLRSHANAHNLKLITRDEFADRVFFGIGYNYRATIVGFNLPFDISRLAIYHAPGRGSGGRGGFTFKISQYKRPPYVQVKHLSRRSAFIQFTAPSEQTATLHSREIDDVPPIRRGHFVDVNTLAYALFAKSFSLATLGIFLRIPNPKLESPEFAGPITDKMATYAVRDVQATWECYCTLVERFDILGLAETQAEKIYSEASIGKACLHEMGLSSWRNMQPDFPRQMLANIMGSYFGGRSEVRIRRELRQVMLCDFLSMYPTVCTLMGLWRFVIAQGMTWRDATGEARQLLDMVDIETLKSKAIWGQLAMLVRVQPNADIFPVRSNYSAEPFATIGLNHLTTDQPVWFTLADCIAAKLLSGKAPEIVEAVAFEAGPVQTGLKPVNVSGNPDYAVDPAKDDFFKRVIELRHAIKQNRDGATGLEYDALNTDQNALKIAANATSYGIYVEVIVADEAESFGVTVHSATCKPFSIRTLKHEKEGSFFHPLLASFITGGARLMLAMTETLIKNAGLEWAFCDTDSMAIAKPELMPVPEFHKRVETIVAWFSGLNPYSFDGSILKIEDVNFSLDKKKEYAPLFVWAISAKRYALFNIDASGAPVIRKASAHGLGHLMAPYDETKPAKGIPAPSVPVDDIGIEHWQHDFWWQIVSAALGENPNHVPLDFHPALEAPAISRYGATSPVLLRWFDGYNEGRPYADQVKPFGFLLSLSTDIFADIGDNESGQRGKAKMPKPIAAYDLDPIKAAQSAFDRQTGEMVAPDSLKSMRDALMQYHMHPESKFLNGDYLDRGITRRRHVYATGFLHIGKEANQWEEQAALGFDPSAAPDYGISPERGDVILSELRELAKSLGRTPIAKALGISNGRLRFALGGMTANRNVMVRKGLSALPRLRTLAEAQAASDLELETQLREAVKNHGWRGAAKLHGLDASNLRRKLSD